MNVFACQTTACIAGETVLLSRKDVLRNRLIKGACNAVARIKGNKAINFSEEAQKLLNINEFQAEQLFHVVRWPDNFKWEYNSAGFTNFKKLAKVTSDRIEHFIKTNGAE
jgi:hypothetical protein